MSAQNNTSTNNIEPDLRRGIDFIKPEASILLSHLSGNTDEESFMGNFKSETMDECLFKDCLITAINEKKYTNFVDEIYGIPIYAKIENNRLNIYILVKHVVYVYEDKHQNGSVEVLSLDLAYFNQIGASKSAFGPTVQEFYFMNKEGGPYTVIIFEGKTK